jgi:hypothetical protein
MLRSLKELERYTVSATDANVGSVVNFLLDDACWSVRYLVVATGPLVDDRRVLISPISFRQAAWMSHSFHLALTMDKIKNSPPVDVDAPISRDYERDYCHYYGYPYYWGSSGLWGKDDRPGALAAGRWNEARAEHPARAAGQVHLRSTREVGGYHFQGSDEAIGRVEDFLVDDTTWQVRYMAIDTSSWWFGKKVLIAPHWASRIDWAERKVYLDVSRQAIKDSPEWNGTAAIARTYETRLYAHYGHPVFWAAEGA